MRAPTDATAGASGRDFEVREVHGPRAGVTHGAGVLRGTASRGGDGECGCRGRVGRVMFMTASMAAALLADGLEGIYKKPRNR